MKNQKTKRNILIALVAVCLVFVAVMGAGFGKIITGTTVSVIDETPDEYFAIINIKGTIQAGNEGNARVGYDHFATLNYIDQLMKDEGNKGILLDVDSGGGTVYESDEMYLKLLEYKETTGRPIHAYFNGTACSGAYYIACAADYISGNRNGWTGSIGVIISTVNYSELYGKLGIKEVLITSGDNKAMGSAGSEMTEEHRAIYQSLVDESYEQFVEIVALGRDMSIEKTKELADGRIYSNDQALDNGLIDNVEDYATAYEYMEEVCGADGYYEQLYYPTMWEEMFARVQTIVPKSDMAAVSELVNSPLNGVPLYMYTK